MMRSISLLVTLLSSLSTFCNAADQTVTVYAWPPSAASPQQLAQITYNRDPLSTPTISNYKSPTIASIGDNNGLEPLVRVGLYDASTKDWRGVVTAASSFDPKYQQKIDLYLDLDGHPWHVGFSAYPKPTPTPRARRVGDPVEVVPQVVTEVLVPRPGPTPHLNKPVVLTAEGKVEEKPEEKTFLQKYWWMILIFLAIQAFSSATGGDDEKKK